jgi:4-hydroxybenzoate polyprenyltransferase
VYPPATPVDPAPVRLDGPATDVPLARLHGPETLPPPVRPTPGAAPDGATAPAVAEPDAWFRTLGDYVAIARPDHWFKNVFMALGVLLAFFYHPDLFVPQTAFQLLWALLATCLLASSNYVINEVLDAPTDRTHPLKCRRPVPSGRVWLPAAYAEWLLLGAAGLWMAYALNWSFFYTGAILLGAGLVYNVPPVRTKDLPVVDVLSESLNNAIRLALGWFALAPAEFPPVSLLISYWMIGAFFMAAKRLAEYRTLGDPVLAGRYRNSFRYYDEELLLVSISFYTTTFALFAGVFVVRYHLELILMFPLIAGLICYYLWISFKKESPTQSPERLYRERGLMAYLVLCLVAFVTLMFAHIPSLYALFNIEPSPVPPLWRL